MDRAVPYILVGLLAIALVVVIGAVAVQGVSNLADGEGYTGSGEPWVAPEGPDPAFVYASPQRLDMVRPMYLSGPLPRAEWELGGERRPLPGIVRARLATGDRATQTELVSALEALAETANDDLLGQVYDPLIGGIRTPAHCAWLRRVLEERPDVPLRRSFWDALLWCDDPATASFMERDDVPAETRITWWEAHHLDGGPIDTEQLVEAIVEVAGRGRAGSATRGARVLVAADPDGAEALGEAAARIRGGDLRRELALMAETRSTGSSRPTVDEIVRKPTVDLDLLAARTDAPDRVARALVRCVVPTEENPTDEARAVECLRVLAAESPPMAIQAARALRRWGVEMPHLRESVHALLDVGNPAVVRSRLVQHGLLHDDLPAVDGTDYAVAPRDVLRAHDRVLCFPTDPGQQPVEYREVLHRLAYLARPVFADTVFDQSSPEGTTYDYRLDAWVDRMRSSVWAYDQGSVYDVSTMLGFLNALSRDRGSNVRFALLSSTDWSTTCVVAGPEQGLLDAEREGLVTLAEP